MAFEGILARPDPRPARWRRAMLTTSLAIHAVALAVVVVRSQWVVDEMALPAIQVTLTEAPPPPPPPPPPAGAKKATTKPRIKVPSKTEIVQPKETPKEEPKPEEPDNEDNGQVGGEKGGVANGVVGGVVGGTPPPPPKITGPAMLSHDIGTHLLAINTNAPPYCCPKIPRALENVDQFVAHLQICVDATGQVTDVRILSGAGPAIDAQIPTYVRRWRYHPFLMEGRASPFCYPLEYQISQR
jgi:protein TonB